MEESDYIYKSIGRTIRHNRIKANLTQDELAEKLELSRTSVTHIEAGRQRIQIHTLYAIAKALGVLPHSLMPSLIQSDNKRCDVCGIDFMEIYGNLSDALHIKPWRTKLEKEPDNGIFLCPNCNELLDVNPGLTVEKLSKRVKKRLRASQSINAQKP